MDRSSRARQAGVVGVSGPLAWEWVPASAGGAAPPPVSEDPQSSPPLPTPAAAAAEGGGGLRPFSPTCWLSRASDSPKHPSSLQAQQGLPGVPPPPSSGACRCPWIEPSPRAELLLQQPERASRGHQPSGHLRAGRSAWPAAASLPWEGPGASAQVRLPQNPGAQCMWEGRGRLVPAGKNDLQ